MAKHQQPARMGFFGAFARLLGGSFLLFVGGFVAFVLLQAPPAANTVKTEAVVVLTGGPGRIARGVQVLQSGAAKRMLVSGVDQKVRAHEFVAASGVSLDLFTCCVDLGFQANSTRTNAEEVVEWVRRNKVKSLRLVTAGYHMHRAEAELLARLPGDIVVVPDGVQAGLPFVAMGYEYVKFLGSWVLLRARARDGSL